MSKFVRRNKYSQKINVSQSANDEKVNTGYFTNDSLREMAEKFVNYERNPELEKIAHDIISVVEKAIRPTLQCADCGSEQIHMDVSDYIIVRDFIVQKLKKH